MNNRGSSQIILKPGQSFASTVGKVKADEDGTAEKAITLKNGEKAEFYKIPYGTEHQIKEEKNEYEPSYRIDAATVVKAANKAPANTDLSTETEIIDMGEDNTVKKTKLVLTNGKEGRFMLIKSLFFVALECMFCYCAVYVVYHQKEYSGLKTFLLKTVLII